MPKVRRCRPRRTSLSSFWACIGGYKVKPLVWEDQGQRWAVQLMTGTAKKWISQRGFDYNYIIIPQSGMSIGGYASFWQGNIPSVK